MNNRELDAKVAELMKWHWDDAWGCLIPPEQKAKPSEMWTEWKTDAEGLFREPIKGAMVSGLSYNGDSSKVILPHFSTDIAAALPVLEKWTDAEIEKAGGNYRVTLIGAPIVTADAETLPLAICRAALKAVEEGK